jgi:hypothetical protein
VLGTFPRGTRLAILAPSEYGYAEIVAERSDPATVAVPLEGTQVPQHAALAACDNILLEGLDAVADPVALLRSVALGKESVRLFALVANAAYFGALAQFYFGEPLAAAHPLVLEELVPLLEAGGWHALEINSIYDDRIAEHGPLPTRIEMPGMLFNVTEESMLARGRIHAFIAIADAS